VLDEKRETSKDRHRIAIHHELGSVKHGALQVIESPFAAGEQVRFEGKATHWGTAPDAQTLATQLQTGLRFLTHIGANRGIGFGRVLEASVSLVPSSEGVSPSLPQHLDPSSSYTLTLKVHGPLCISRHKIGGNLFESEDFIPGNMIAGAIMQTASALGHKIDTDLFNQVRFCHAFPAPAGSPRPTAVPLSYVKAKDNFYDVTHQPNPILINGIAPAFSGDWKPSAWKIANVAHHRHDPERELRVRTAIDYEKRTAKRTTQGPNGEEVEGGSLFAWEVIHPSDGTNDLLWHSKIDLSAIQEPAQQQTILDQLQPILAHLGFLSKTKASANCTLTENPATDEPKLGGTVALVLQTPALLADPRHQTQSFGAISAPEMLKHYQAAWNDLSGDSLALTHFFAQQKLAGGGYLSRRFKKRKDSKDFNPFLLTTEGSVFVFEVKDAAKAKTTLKTWLAQNLPLPEWAKEAHGSTWEHHPYLPQNGFGEIAIHTSHPDFPAPSKDIITNITTL
jgi:hypothetical protein